MALPQEKQSMPPELREFIDNFLALRAAAHKAEEAKRLPKEEVPKEEPPKVTRLKLFITPKEDDPIHKSRCQYKNHLERGSLLPVCNEHQIQIVCGPFWHGCLECNPHQKKTCGFCSAEIWKCCC